ncbi:MAG: hypothetical protein ABI822_27615 [Bryobacteraceae bacterium]
MKTPPVVCLLALFCLLAPAQTSTSDVGSGAPSDAIARSFVAAYFRSLFYTQLSLPPLSDVKKFGTTGLVQEFADAAKTTGVKFALIKPNTATQASDGSDVFQLTGLIYSYYSSVGVSTAGQPTTDTLNCPDASCQYQFYDKNYILFAYLKSNVNGQTFTLRDPFYTKWIALGGIGSLGPPNNAELAVTSPVSGAAATVQTYKNGALYNITSGVLTGRFAAVTACTWPTTGMPDFSAIRRAMRSHSAAEATARHLRAAAWITATPARRHSACRSIVWRFPRVGRACV